MDFEKLNRATKHLHKCFRLFHIWELGVVNSSYAKLFYESNILGAVGYGTYEMLNIKLNIFFESGGKHSLSALIQLLPDGKSKTQVARRLREIKRKNSKTIKDVEWLRNKYFAHYDDVELSEGVDKFSKHNSLLDLLSDIQDLFILIWYNAKGEVPFKFDSVAFTSAIIEVFEPLLPDTKAKGIRYHTSLI